MNLNGFDANTVDPQESRDPIPAGWYKCAITASEEKPTKAMTGSYLQLEGAGDRRRTSGPQGL